MSTFVIGEVDAQVRGEDHEDGSSVGITSEQDKDDSTVKRLHVNASLNPQVVDVLIDIKNIMSSVLIHLENISESLDDITSE